MSTPAAPAATSSAASGERLLPLEEALSRLLGHVEPLPAEMALLVEAAGRMLAADVYAETALPPWDNAAMDGFAVRADDVADAAAERPVRLQVRGDVPAGVAPSSPLEPGTAIRIATGAPLPAGADAVVPIENTSAWRGPRAVVGAPLAETVQVLRSARAGESVRRRGDDVEAGSRILHAGRLLGAGAVALCAAVGRDRVSVIRCPHLGLLATGDEIVAPGSSAGPGQIHDATTAALSVLGRRAGAIVRSFGIAPDDLEAVVERLAEAVGWADVVVVSGGVSVGPRDVVKDAFERLGSVDFWRVAVQPGKPLAFGRAERPRGAPAGGPVLLFGLPGNPVSSYVTFELFVRPALRALSGLAPTRRAVRRARLAERLPKSPDRRAFLRVRLDDAGRNGSLPLARSAGNQGSHAVSALAAADGLAVVPEGRPAGEPGEEVDVWLLEDEA